MSGVRVNTGFVTTTLTKKDGTPLMAGELQSGDEIFFDWDTGIITDVKSETRCTYPLCNCAVGFPKDYQPSVETECPRM